MDEETYIKALDAAVEEQRQVYAEMSLLEKRAARLEETITTLLRLINDSDEDIPVTAKPRVMPLTATVRNVLKASGDEMTPTEVRDGLIRMGVNESEYSNLLASVHNILKRLFNSGEIAKHEAADGTIRYQWVSQNPKWFDKLVAAGVMDKMGNPPVLNVLSGHGSAPTPAACPICHGTGMEVVPGKGARVCACRAGQTSADPEAPPKGFKVQPREKKKAETPSQAFTRFGVKRREDEKE